MTVRVAQHYGVGRFRDGADFYQAASRTDATDAADNMFRVLVAQLRRPLDSSNKSIAGTHGPSSGGGGDQINPDGGWEFLFDGTNFNFSVSDGLAVRNASVADPGLRAGDLLVIAGTRDDGSGIRVRSGWGASASVATGVGANLSEHALAIGVEAAGNDQPASEIVVVGVLGNNTDGLTDAQLETLIAEIEDNLHHGRALDSGLSVITPSFYYDAADLADDASTWVDRLGVGPDLARSGAPELFGVSARVTA